MPIPLLIPLIMAGVSAAGGIASSISAGNKADQAQKDLQARRDKAEQRYLHEIGTDFLDTKTAKSTLAQIRRQNDKQMASASNDAVRRGASDEAKVALAGRLNENMADSTSRLAGMGTQYKQQIEDRYLRRVDSLDDAMHNAKLGKAESMGDMAGAWGNLTGASLQTAFSSPGIFKSTLSPQAINAHNGAYARDLAKNTIGKNTPTLSPYML